VSHHGTGLFGTGDRAATWGLCLTRSQPLAARSPRTILPACSSSLRSRPPRSVPGCDRHSAGAGVRAHHRRSEAATGEAAAVDAAGSGQESTIVPAFAATAEMIAAFSRGQL
jgi:hypothetical protein